LVIGCLTDAAQLKQLVEQHAGIGSRDSGGGTQRDVVDARSPAGVVGYRCRGRLHRTGHRPLRREIEQALRGGSDDRARG